MEINLSGIKSAEATNNSSTSTFKRVEPGIHTLTISKVEEAKLGTKSVLRVTFDSAEAEASFPHDYFVQGNTDETTKKLLERVQYLIEKFTGAALEGNFNPAALSAVLVGKSKVCMVDGRVRGVQKDGKWYNNTYATLAWAGYVDPAADAKPNIDQRDAVNLEVLNNPVNPGAAASTSDNDLPF